MAAMTGHVCLDVAQALRYSQKQLGAMFKHPDGRPVSAREATDYLKWHRIQGHEVIPIGPACEGFDYKTGCPGHPDTEGEA